MSNLHLLPVAVFLLFQFTFIGTYIAAILQGHVVPAIPYISDAATYSPESCVFGQFINIGCVLLGIVIYLRYRQIEELARHHLDQQFRLNWIALWIGIGSCLGCSVVGNFQETNVRIVHFIGAFCCFGFGTIYYWLQAVLSYQMHPYTRVPLALAHIRLGLAMLCAIFFVVVAVTGVISHILFNGQDPRKWYPSDGGWEYHVASSISEWIVATIFCFYILTFTDEFRVMSVDHPVIAFVSDEELLIVEDYVTDSRQRSATNAAINDVEYSTSGGGGGGALGNNIEAC